MRDTISLQLVSRSLAFNKHDSTGETASHPRTGGKLVLAPREAKRSDYSLQTELCPEGRGRKASTSLGCGLVVRETDKHRNLFTIT